MSRRRVSSVLAFRVSFAVCTAFTDNILANDGKPPPRRERRPSLRREREPWPARERRPALRRERTHAVAPAREQGTRSGRAAPRPRLSCAGGAAARRVGGARGDAEELPCEFGRSWAPWQEWPSPWQRAWRAPRRNRRRIRTWRASATRRRRPSVRSATTCLIEATDCEAERASLCNADATSATASGTRNYTQGNAQACIDALNAVYGNGATKVSFAQLEGMGSVSDICERVFSGNAGMNEPCQSSYDCTGEQHLRVGDARRVLGDGGAGPYVCAPPGEPIAEGQFCTTPGSTCVTDSYCAVKPGSAATCVPAMQENQPCNTVTAPCVSAQRCESQAGVTGQTCEPRVALGGRARRATTARRPRRTAIRTSATSARRVCRSPRAPRTAKPSSRATPASASLRSTRAASEGGPVVKWR